MRYIIVLAMLCPFLSMCQPLALKGKIINEQNEPVPFASVSIQGVGAVALSDSSGNFHVSGLHPSDTLIITATGYEPTVVPFDVNARGTITITLKPLSSLLDDAVIIAYGKTTRRLNTGSVSRLSAADISRQPVSNPLAALEGRIPGLTVVQSSGLPGASIKIQLRGQSSMVQGSEPLFIIDGVPFAPNNQNINGLSSLLTPSAGMGLSPFNTINPASIESIEVLKDADATAIYGSRGANGVVLITTKKGKAGSSKFSFSLASGISRATRLPNMLNTSQYLQMRREAFANDGLTPDSTNAPDLLLWDTARYTNFSDLLLGGTAHASTFNTTLSGGTAATRFLMGAAYHRETTVFPGNMNDSKGSVLLNLGHSSADKRFGLELSTTYALDANNLAAAGLCSFINLPPHAPNLYNGNGQLNWEENGFAFINPLAYLQKKYRAVTNNLLSNLQLSYTLAGGLTLRSSLGYNRTAVEERLLDPMASQNPALGLKGSSSHSFNQFKSWLFEPQLNYIRPLGKATLNLLMGGTWQQTTSSGLAIAGSGYTNDALLQSLDAAPLITSRSNSFSAYRYQALFARINYNYKTKYIFNLSGRRDGSSRFGPGRQFSTFAALGAAWLFSEEAFIKNKLHGLTFGKLRASYGTTGNDQIGDYKYLDAWSVGQPYQGSTTLYPAALFNDSYSWEVNKKWEAALELGLFKNSLLFSLAWFRNRSSNQLIEYVLPSQTGFFGINSNFPALVQNTGLEVELNTTNMATGIFTWTTRFNITLPRNKLLAFPGLATSSYAATYVEGQPLSLIYKLGLQGVDPQTGVFAFTDHDKNGSIDIPADFQALGYLAPRYYGGLGNTFQWKNWECNIFFSFTKQQGAGYLNTIYANNFIPGTLYNQPVDVMDRWQKPGDKTTVQKFTATTASEAYLQASNFTASGGGYSDASFARLKTISLSCNLKSIGKWKPDVFRLYLQGQNLFTFTSYNGADPETQNLYSLPPLRTLMAGIQFTF